MTLIIGLVHKEKVYIGGDSCSSNNIIKTIRKDAKVFRKEEFIIGFTSSWRMGQLLMSEEFKIEKPKDDDDIFKYMLNIFIPAVIKLFKDNGYAIVENNVVNGGHFLVGYKNRLFKIQSDFQIEESQDEYNTCGVGEEIALGVMYALKDKKLSPTEKILTALNASQHHNVGVQSPFILLNT